MAEAQKHLMEQQQHHDLHQVLDKCTTLFNGQLKVYPDSKVHLNIKPNAQLRKSRPNKVPYAHQEVFRKELDCLVQQGVLSPTTQSIWTTPTFIIPKKDERVSWVSNFKYLNQNLQRKQYKLPRIKEFLERRKGTNTLPNLISPCSTMPLSSMRPVKIFAPSQHPLGYKNTTGSLWGS